MKTLKEAQIKNRTALLRVDFNVDIEDGRVREDFRMRATLPTIKYLLDGGAKKIVVMTHLGRPEGKWNRGFSASPIAGHLSDILGEVVELIVSDIRNRIRSEIETSDSRILLLENLRFYKEEEENDRDFSENLASLGDFFVQDAFGVSHRSHASIVGVPKFLPSYAGLLLEKEVSTLSAALERPVRPLVALIGGAKISTKIAVIERFLQIADNVALGGALANTALEARGMAIGKSYAEKGKGINDKIKNINFTDIKLHLPLDVKVAKDKDARSDITTKGAGGVFDDELILDIGPDTQRLFSNIINRSKTIVWNGPMGYIENEAFKEGTHTIAKSIAGATKNGAFSIIGGGDTYPILDTLGIMDDVSFISTGGGAMLDFIAKGTLPGIEVLK